MSDSGHCRHCVRGKDGRGHPYCNTLGDHDFHRRNGDGWWMDSWSACPACDEAKRIAAFIEAERKQREGLAEASDSPRNREYHRGVDHGLVLSLRATRA